MLSFKGQSQSPALNSINQQLRVLFENLDKPTPSLHFLYDMAAHMSDSTLYTTYNNADTLDADAWFMVYGEMYHSAYDTLKYEYSDSLWFQANDFSSDTIPIGIMRYSFYKFKSDALTTDNYFDFDTVLTKLDDHHPRASWPYLDSALLIASPLIGASQYSNPVFRIDPNFIFLDSALKAQIALSVLPYRLKIDFDDGNGWVTFSPTSVANYQVNYSTEGTKLIKTGIFNGLGTLVDYSQAKFSILRVGVRVLPDEILQLPGMTVGLYGGCESDLTSGRVILFVEGFDPWDFLPSKNTDVSKIYTERISKNPVVQLKNFGYTFLVIDWESSQADLRFNALYLENLLEYLKGLNTGNEEFVIIGQSLGGLIARYTLTYMESQQYQSETFEAFFQDEEDENDEIYLSIHPIINSLPSTINHKERLHNTRLLILDDTPNQGANIPLSLQYAYDLVIPNLKGLIPIGAALFNLSGILLHGQACQQLLVNSIDNISGTPPYFEHGERPEKAKFFTQLYSMGNYPEFTKVVAMSNGSISGKLQYNKFADEVRSPGDLFIGGGIDFYARVLWITLPIFEANITCNTNSDGDGLIFDANVGAPVVIIKLKWFGVKITYEYISLMDETIYGHTLPICTNAGGEEDFGDFTNIDKEEDKWGFNWLLIGHQGYNDGSGCLFFENYIGINGFASLNFDREVCSDGMNFCFVPVQSALDYGESFSDYYLDMDIASQDITTKLSLTPADVIEGIPTGYQYGVTMYDNQPHNFLRNDHIYNLTLEPSPFEGHEFTYYSCISEDKHIERGFLNLEIGDEELYLENVTQAVRTKYQTEFDIHVNDRNPHYEYEDYINLDANINILGIYSKEADYLIDESFGTAEFHYNATGSPSINPGLTYLEPVADEEFYDETDESFDACCNNYLNAKIDLNFNTYLSTLNKLLIYPNPNNGKRLSIMTGLNFYSEQNWISISNSLGQSIYSQHLNISPQNAEEQTITLDHINLQSGIYLLSIYSGNLLATAKFTVQN